MAQSVEELLMLLEQKVVTVDEVRVKIGLAALPKKKKSKWTFTKETVIWIVVGEAIMLSTFLVLWYMLR